MKPHRLTAFTDGVFAIIITIMVLELRVPNAASWSAIQPTLPLFGAYALSFVMVGIFWNNHHHLFQAVESIDGRVLWANLFLLFWLSLFPFVIRWIGESGVTANPVAAYGLVLTMGGGAYLILEKTLIGAEKGTRIDAAVRDHRKEIVTLVLDLIALATAFLAPWLAVAIFFVVAAIWLVPDTRFERS